MPLNISNAIEAYKNAIRPDSGMEAKNNPAENFATLVRAAAGAAVESSQKSEAMAMKAVAGDADIADVVTAVTEAELALQTVVAVRDKVIQAYQDIIRMPL